MVLLFTVTLLLFFVYIVLVAALYCVTGDIEFLAALICLLVGVYIPSPATSFLFPLAVVFLALGQGIRTNDFFTTCMGIVWIGFTLTHIF